jgi:hypothetical protein
MCSGPAALQEGEFLPLSAAASLTTCPEKQTAAELGEMTDPL